MKQRNIATPNRNATTSSTRRRSRGAMACAAALVIACGASVQAFSAPTMKVDFGIRKSSGASSGGNKLRKSSGGAPVGSPLDMICQDQHEFELSVGHAMDTLRQDYPDILTESPDFSIYAEDLELIDPSGVQLHGVKNYRAAFRLMHAIVGLFYCPERSSLTFRMCFDKARQNIRIHWNAQVIPKAIFGGYKTTLHVDGISVYEISRTCGNITQHRIERLVINDNAVQPENGIFVALRGYAKQSNVDSIPVFNVAESARSAGGSNRPGSQHDLENVVRFQNFSPRSRSSLFAFPENDETASRLSMSAESSSPLDSSGSSHKIDWDALEKKNQARKKFGLAPLTPEEFSDLQEQVAELDSQQQKRAAAAAADLANKKKEEEGGFLKQLFGKALENTCESNFDCQHPEVCCDFGFKKVCCTSGMRILDGPPRSRQGQLAEIPVIANPGPYPPDDRRNNYPF